VLRVEDLDTPRCQPGAEARQLADLRWLGLDWDEGPDCGGSYGPYRQSQRLSRYEAALGELEQRGLIYLCDCSRSEIARAASAPHAGDEGPRYPGICRAFGMRQRAFKRSPAVRLAVPEEPVLVEDGLQGRLQENVSATVGDFVLRRGDGVFAYQLAVVVDDLAMHISEVVRGVDLLTSAARQTLLARLLLAEAPRYAHHALVVDAGGERLAKRAASLSIAALRNRGLRPGQVNAGLARALGLVGPECDACSPRELLGIFDRTRLAGRTTAQVPSFEASSTWPGRAQDDGPAKARGPV
jgi:glutamyl-tRNA synthetase